MLKINSQGVVTDSAAVTPEAPVLEEKLEQAEETIAELEAQGHPGTGEEMTGVEAPADGTMPPLVGNDPVPGGPEPEQVTQLPAGESAVSEPIAPPRPPRVPPRRVPPGAAGG